MSDDDLQVQLAADAREARGRTAYAAAQQQPIFNHGRHWSELEAIERAAWRTIGDAVAYDAADEIAQLRRGLRRSDTVIRRALAQLEAAAADNATLCRLLGLDVAGHPGADLLADYHRLKQIAEAADGYIRYGGADRWQVLRQALDADVGQAEHERPRVVCLCGSTRFYETFQLANYRETMAGRIVLSVGFYPHRAEQAHGEAIGCTPEQKAALDVLHLRKIDLADEVLVLDVGGYIGESTAREIAYARRRAIPVRYWSATPASGDTQAGGAAGIWRQNDNNI